MCSLKVTKLTVKPSVESRTNTCCVLSLLFIKIHYYTRSLTHYIKTDVTIYWQTIKFTCQGLIKLFFPLHFLLHTNSPYHRVACLTALRWPIRCLTEHGVTKYVDTIMISRIFKIVEHETCFMGRLRYNMCVGVNFTSTKRNDKCIDKITIIIDYWYFALKCYNNNSIWRHRFDP